MDDIIKEILTEMTDPVPEEQIVIDLDNQPPPQVQLSNGKNKPWAEILNDTNNEFEVYGVEGSEARIAYP